jgi:hypothetical protein
MINQLDECTLMISARRKCFDACRTGQPNEVNMHKRSSLFLAGIVCSVLLLLAPASEAQVLVKQADFQLHANAIHSLQLTPEVATRTGITRSGSRGLLNIAVRRSLEDGGDKAVPAEVTATAINLEGQRQLLRLREVREGDAIYYLAEPRIVEGEALRFEIAARPEGSAVVIEAKMSQTFFAPLPR